MGLVLLFYKEMFCLIKHMGHSAFAQTHKERKMGFNYTHWLLQMLVNYLMYYTTKLDRGRERWAN